MLEQDSAVRDLNRGTLWNLERIDPPYVLTCDGMGEVPRNVMLACLYGDNSLKQTKARGWLPNDLASKSLLSLVP
jgi:hypothetical protein